MPSKLEGALTAKELADRWGVSVGTIYNRRHRGLPMPPGIRTLGTLRFPLEDVEHFELMRHQETASAQALRRVHRQSAPTVVAPAWPVARKAS